MIPASANATQTALPATSPAVPSSEKMPAPTIAPTPMNAAWRVVTWRRRDGAGRADRGHATASHWTSTPTDRTRNVSTASRISSGHTNLS